MVEIDYVGELLWPKYIGQFLLIAAFFSTILSAISYYLSNKLQNNSWKKLGNLAFSFQGISMLSVIALIFYVMIQKHYEYSYVQAHVNDALPFQYVFSAFWEGQEGSFMLWIFWHNILAWIIMWKNSKWVAPVLFYLSLIQLVLLSMIQGIYFIIGDWFYKLGSNPLSLLRDTMDIPLFSNAEYVTLLEGTGLNPLLQNYWMTIHPPVLFLGFASVSIPFCFALASLHTKEYRSWLKPTLRWGLFSASILGIGILMGAAWAYEALTFGGYWAWDPVENTSLVPWITLVAGIHTNLIARNTKYSVKSTYWFYILSFLLIVYSTTLTRSGILGDTSVHAFTEMGLESQLAFFIGFFSILSIVLYAIRSGQIDAPKKEESIGSKEFWMFIGSLVLLFSAIMITASSSLPIFNKLIALFNPDFIGYVIDDVVEHYNKYQLWIGVLIGFLSGISIFFRYNEKNAKRFWGKPKTHLLFVTIATGVAHFALNLWLKLTGFQFHLLLFSALFTIIASLEHIFFYTMAKKGSQAPKKSNYLASVLAHGGFGLMIIGVIASGLNKKYISENQFVMDGIMDEEAARKNITLLKNRPMFMNGYWVTYSRDTVIGQNKYFDLDFRKVDASGKDTLDAFQLTPNVLYSNDLTKIAARNPATRHFFLKDIFVSVESLPLAQQDIKFAQEMEDTLNYEIVSFPYDETIQHDNYSISLKDIQFSASHPDYSPETGDVPMQISLELKDSVGNYALAKPAIVLRNTVVYKYHAHEDNFHSRFRVNERSYDELIKPDIALEYLPKIMTQGSEIGFEGYQIKFIQFNKMNPTDPLLKKEDIGVECQLIIKDKEGRQKQLTPKFIIRNNQIIPLRDMWWQESFYARLTKIDPESGAATIEFAKDKQDRPNVFLEIATNVPRQDILAIQAIEFPGINFVWLGCILMMIGLGFGMVLRLSKS